MYSSRNLIYILTILESIEKCSVYTDGILNHVQFVEYQDQINYNATIHLLLVMGEEAKKIEDDLKAEFSTVPWQRIIAMRNYLAHDYRGVDPERAFDVVQNQLPSLKETLIRMLEKVAFDKAQLEEALNSYFYRHLTYLKDKLND